MSSEGIIPIEGLHKESMKQKYERDDILLHMYSFLLNNCRKLSHKRYRITRLKLRFSVNVSSTATLRVISLKRNPGDGIQMYYLHEQDGESLYGVQNEDFDFDNKVSRSTEKRVVYEKVIQPGMVVDTVTFETQKWYDYGNESLPNMMLFVMIKTPDDPEGIGYFTFEREMDYLIE